MKVIIFFPFILFFSWYVSALLYLEDSPKAFSSFFMTTFAQLSELSIGFSLFSSYAY